MTTLAASREARYNYEAPQTGSAWVGYKLSGGERIAWEFIPMIGGVVGDTWGSRPATEGRSAGGGSSSPDQAPSEAGVRPSRNTA
jgi:hypothetical protein